MLVDALDTAIERSFDLLQGTELHEFRSFLCQCLDRMDQPMQIAIIGEICSSKSTLVNAMLGQEEIVRTGAMEETFNVSWLKYGNPEADIAVHFKDGRVQDVSRKLWEVWANRIGQESMQSNVSFIKVMHDNPSLKIFNIIDTPGLNAYSGIDSQNTIDFLKKVNPDAVVLLFTKGIARRTVDVIKAFQGSLPGQMTPVNAVGVLSKIDVYWPEEEDPIAAGKRIASRLFQEETSIHNTLYQLHPVCAGLAVGSMSLNDRDVESFKLLSEMDERTFQRMISTLQRFEADNTEIPVPGIERKRLSQKFTRYGVACAVELMRKNRNSPLEEVEKLLLEKSGFGVFYDSLIRHFGNRSHLIKFSALLSDILSFTVKAQQKVTGKEKDVLLEIENIFIELSLKQHELQELELLRDFYAGEIELSESEEDELVNITGENGLSCTEKLGLPDLRSIQTMKLLSEERYKYWHTKRMTTTNPKVKEAAHVMEKSYRVLGKELDLAECRLDDVTNFIWGISYGEMNHENRK